MSFRARSIKIVVKTGEHSYHLNLLLRPEGWRRRYQLTYNWHGRCVESANDLCDFLELIWDAIWLMRNNQMSMAEKKRRHRVQLGRSVDYPPTLNDLMDSIQAALFTAGQKKKSVDSVPSKRYNVL